MAQDTKELRKRLLEPPQYTILGDEAIATEHLEADHFDLSRRIGALYDILRHPETDTPMTIGIFGDWGSGKTSAMRWLEGRLRDWNEKAAGEKGNITVHTAWFYPWKYDSKEDVWRGLIAEAVIACLKSEENSFEGFLSAAKDLGGFLGGSFVDLLSGIKLSVGSVGEIDLQSLKDIRARAGDYVSPQNAYLNEFETALQGWIVKTLGDNERMVIFIDDLDRCLPEITLQVLEALKLYLNIPKLIFVVGVDENVVNDLVKKHYESHGLSEEKSRNYLAKMFQVEVRLAPSETEIEGFLDALLARSSAWKEIQDETARDVFRKIIHRLGGRSPREIKRLINSSMLALAGARLAAGPAEAAGSAPTAVEQMQVFFVRQVLQKPQINRASLVGENRGTRFFTAWSEAVRGGASPTFQVDSAITELVERTSSRSGGKSEAALNLEKLLAEVPEGFQQILKERTFVSLFVLLADQDLGELMRLPYSEEAVSIGQNLVPETEAALIREAAARSLEMALEEFGEKDHAKVTELDLSGTELSNLEPVKTLVNLVTLDLGETGVFDLKPIEALRNLEKLILTRTPISDLEPLRVLAKLRRLYIVGTDVYDFEPLAALTNLEDLTLLRTKISNLEPLITLLNLRSLNLMGTAIVDLDAIAALPKLEHLFLDKTPISSLEQLTPITKLKMLSLSEMPISDLRPLMALNRLKRLYLDNTPVTDLKPLEELTNLNYVNLAGTNVQDLDPLKSLPLLRKLELQGTKIPELVIAELQASCPKLEIVRD